MSQTQVYEFTSWRDIGGSKLAVSVNRVLNEFRKYYGELPDNLDDEKAVSAFAGACDIPLAAADIEADLHFPNRRYASRQFVRDQYPDFVLWCMENGWLDGKAEVTVGGSMKADSIEAAV